MYSISFETMCGSEKSQLLKVLSSMYSARHQETVVLGLHTLRVPCHELHVLYHLNCMNELDANMVACMVNPKW